MSVDREKIMALAARINKSSNKDEIRKKYFAGGGPEKEEKKYGIYDPNFVGPPSPYQRLLLEHEKARSEYEKDKDNWDKKERYLDVSRELGDATIARNGWLKDQMRAMLPVFTFHPDYYDSYNPEKNAIRESQLGEHIIDYMKDFASSPGYDRIKNNAIKWYEDKFSKEIPKEYVKGIDSFRNNMKNLLYGSVFEVDAPDYVSFNKLIDPFSPSYSFSVVGNSSDNFPKTFLAGHEVAHSVSPVVQLSTKSSFPMLNKIALDENQGTEYNNHDELTSEKYADKEGLMILLNEEGIYDSRSNEDCTPEQIHQLREKYPNLRPLQQMDDEQAAWMINHVADSGERDSIHTHVNGNYAKFGGLLLRRYDGGGPKGIAPMLPVQLAKKYLTDYVNRGGVTGYPKSLSDWVAYVISPYASTQFDWEKDKDYVKVRRALLAKYLGIEDGLDFNPDDYIEESPYKPNKASDPNAVYYRPKRPVGEVATALFGAVAGNHVVDKGEDENGRYASFYDVWDLAPFSGKAGKNELGGNPVELYDRVYENEDPFTYYLYYPSDKPKNQKKKVEYKTLELKDGGNIHIKPENRGKFTALKKRTGHSASWFKAHGTPAQKKMAVFALNAKKWKHAEGGPLKEAFDAGKYDVIRAAIDKIKGKRFDDGGDTKEVMRVDSNGNLIDYIEPAVITAKLPSKFHGSQAAARRYAEGYKFGKKVAEARDSAIRNLMPNLEPIFMDESLPEYDRNKIRAEMMMRYSGGATTPFDLINMKASPTRMLMTGIGGRIDDSIYSGDITPKEYLENSNHSNFAGVGSGDRIGLDVPISVARGAFQSTDVTKDAENDFVSAFFNEEMPLENTAMIEQYDLQPFYRKLFGNHYPALFSTTPHVYQIHPDTLSVADKLNDIVNNTTDYNVRGVTTDNDYERGPWYIPDSWPTYYDAGNNTRVDVELGGVKYSKDNDVFDVENVTKWGARPFTKFVTEYGKPYIVSTPWYISTPYYEKR